MATTDRQVVLVKAVMKSSRWGRTLRFRSIVRSNADTAHIALLYMHCRSHVADMFTACTVAVLLGHATAVVHKQHVLLLLSMYTNGYAYKLHQEFTPLRTVQL
jgi:hypothetical protein